LHCTGATEQFAINYDNFDCVMITSQKIKISIARGSNCDNNKFTKNDLLGITSMHMDTIHHTVKLDLEFHLS